jgi:hypothetical protein
MNLLYHTPQEVKSVVVDYLVPLFLLYNILGWVGLPGREAARSQTPPTPEDSAALGKSIWAAWWLGVLLSLAGITAGYRFLGSCPKGQNIVGWEVLIAGLVGGLMGLARGVIPRLDLFRNLKPLIRRRILAFLVACAVAVSITCGVFYCNSWTLLRGVIASVYTAMLIGYTATFVFEVGK